MINLSFELKYIGVELHDKFFHRVIETKILKFSLPIKCEWVEGEIMLKEAENKFIILN